MFVAVDIDEAARRACTAVADRLRASGFPARWVPPENYHLTLAFIGSVELERVETIAAALHGVAPRIAPMRIPLDTVGAFPQAKRARVVWVGPAKAVRAFASACVAVRNALEPLGFSFEAHDDAHVTLARADGRAALPAVAPPRGIVVRADTLTLYRSITAAEGAKYVPLERARLREDS